MKQLFFSLRFALLVFLLGWAVNSMAYDFESGGIWFDRISETEVEAKSFSPLYHSDEHISIPSTVTDGGRTYTVTSIAQSAFSSTSLTSVYIPTTIRYIGSWAFKDCPNLAKVEISDLAAWCKINFDCIRKEWYDGGPYGTPGYYDFFRSGGEGTYYGGNPLEIAHHLYLNNEEVIDLVIPETVDTIPKGAFRGCSELRSVVTGPSVKRIGGFAFGNCGKLKDFTVGENVISLAGPVCLVHDFPSYSAMEPSLFWGTSDNGAPTIIEKLTWNAKNCNSICNTYGTIGSYSIQDLHSLKEVIIGNKVETIPDLFVPYSQITEVNIPNSVKIISSLAFWCCSKLTDVTNLNSVDSIGLRAFENCTALKNLSLGKSITYITDQFNGCTGLESVTIATDNPKYDSRGNCNAIIETATNNLFLGCQNTVIPNTVTSIGYNAFYGCIGLTSITIPNSITSIGINAFYDCSGLTSVTIPNSVISIGNNAFYGCTELSSLIIGDSVTEIGSDAFYGCTNLANLSIGKSVTSIASSAFTGCSGIKECTWNARYCNSLPITKTNLERITIGNEVKRLPDRFVQNSKITEVSIPNSVTYIGSNAFYGCIGLTSITIPNSITSIYYNTFYGCTELTSLTIGNSVTSIGNNAFYGCTELTKITCYAIEPPQANHTSFHNTNYVRAILNVPETSLQNYRNTIPWNRFVHYNTISEDVAPGDVNGDGRLGIDDVSNLIDILLLGNSGDNPGADVNGDGRVNIEDVTALIDKLLFEN